MEKVFYPCGGREAEHTLQEKRRKEKKKQDNEYALDK